jgi:hypothetical protein
MRIEFRAATLVAATLLGGACSRAVFVPPAPRPSSTVVVVNEKPRARELKIPPGHYPPRGMCRLWYAGRPPGRQPRPVPCGSLTQRVVLTRGVFIVHGQHAWDADYDWRGWEKRHPGSVPTVVLSILASAKR